MKASKNLDEGGLPAAVLTNEGTHLSRLDVDVHVVERNLSTEDLRCISNRERGRHCASFFIP